MDKERPIQISIVDEWTDNFVSLVPGIIKGKTRLSFAQLFLQLALWDHADHLPNYQLPKFESWQGDQRSYSTTVFVYFEHCSKWVCFRNTMIQAQWRNDKFAMLVDLKQGNASIEGISCKRFLRGLKKDTVILGMLEFQNVQSQATVSVLLDHLSLHDIDFCLPVLVSAGSWLPGYRMRHRRAMLPGLHS